jgi:hypothetical protein
MSFNPIVSLLTSFLGHSKKHTQSSGQIAFDCPACAHDKGLPHGDGKGNLEVNYEKNVFKCWVCSDYNHMHGSIAKLIKRYGSHQNLKDYIALYGDETRNYIKNVDDKGIDLTLPKEYVKLSDCKGNEPLYKDVIKYLKKRNITKDLIDRYSIGYAYEGDYRGRVIIPSYDKNHILNYFTGRSFMRGIKPKYMNPSVEKANVIVNEHLLNPDATIYLLEGMFDHIVVPNSTPLLGKYVNDKLFYYLQEKSNANVVILLDPDAFKDAVIAYNKLNTGNLRGRVRLDIPPSGHDPSSIYEKLGSDGVVKLLRGAFKPSESRI